MRKNIKLLLGIVVAIALFTGYQVNSSANSNYKINELKSSLTVKLKTSKVLIYRHAKDIHTKKYYKVSSKKLGKKTFKVRYRLRYKNGTTFYHITGKSISGWVKKASLKQIAAKKNAITYKEPENTDETATTNNDVDNTEYYTDDSDEEMPSYPTDNGEDTDDNDEEDTNYDNSEVIEVKPKNINDVKVDDYHDTLMDLQIRERNSQADLQRVKELDRDILQEKETYQTLKTRLDALVAQESALEDISKDQDPDKVQHIINVHGDISRCKSNMSSTSKSLGSHIDERSKYKDPSYYENDILTAEQLYGEYVQKMKSKWEG